MSSHPSIKLDDAADKLGLLYGNVLSTLPYITQGRSGEEWMRDERMDLVRQYEEYKNRMTQGKAKSEERQTVFKPGQAKKHKG